MPYCNQCGKKIDEGSSFCIYCGTPTTGDLKAQQHNYVTPPPVYNTMPAGYGTAPPPMYGAPQVYNRQITVPGQNTFVNSFLSIIVFAVFFIGVLMFGIFASPMFLSTINLGMIFSQGIFLFCPIAFAVVVTTRAKGPDLSIGALIALSSAIIGVSGVSSDSPVTGIFISLLVCAFIGILNGAIITYLHAPAIIVTLLTGFMARGFSNLLLDGKMIPVDNSLSVIADSQDGQLAVGGLIILIVTFLAVFFMIMFSKLGVPTYKRDGKPKLSYMFAYMISSVIASISGLYMISRLGGATPNVGSGFESFIFIVFACAVGSRVMDNRFAPAVYALAPALFYSIIINAMSLLGFDVFLQTISIAVIALILVAVAYIPRIFSSSHGGDDV